MEEVASCWLLSFNSCTFDVSVTTDVPHVHLKRGVREQTNADHTNRGVEMHQALLEIADAE